MAYKVFASVNIGSYEVVMKIFEVSRMKGIREIDCITHHLELGKEVYASGKISQGKVEELCDVLLSLHTIMNGYKIDGYRICATSALRETQNSLIVRDYIEKKTGIGIELLSNSEQRFLDYKSIASKAQEFNSIIQKGTAIIDSGGGSIQFSLFDKDRLVTTQNIRIGNLRIRERLAGVERNTTNMERLMEEMVSNSLLGFRKMYFREREIENLIVVGGNVREVVNKESLTKDEFMEVYDQVVHHTVDEVAEKYDINPERIQLVVPSLVVYKRFIETFGIQAVWVPEVSLGDGMVYEYAIKKRMIESKHDFDQDIIAAARNIAKRYMCSKSHIRAVEEMALEIFDKTRKIHGLDKRQRLLLQIAVILHSCGKYINLSEMSECSYSIIMATEIIGLSHEEREMIANIVRFNSKEFEYFETLSKRANISRESYLLVTKLTAILRVSNALDRSHKQKLKGAKIVRKEKELWITAVAGVDVTLEKGMFNEPAAFFEEVFGIRPVIRQSRSN